MDKPPKITDLEKVVEPHLNGSQLVSYSSRYLTKPGDNYGSLMLAISANVRRPDGANEELPLIAKLPPLTNPLFWDLFKPEVTSLRENALYVDVAPNIRQIQLEAGIPEDELYDLFAKFYGCRISLDKNATTLDRDAVLVLENLQTSGYKAGKRQVMFDLEHVTVALKYVANYHALPIALRQLKPEIFAKDILPKYSRFDMNGEFKEEDLKLFTEQTHDAVREVIGHDEEAFNRFLELEKLNSSFMAQKEECKHSLFTTIAHYDMWINNLMFLYDENGAPKKLKIVDFQLAQYESLAHDLIFCLLSSVETEVLENHFHELLKDYYNEFIDCLTRTKCDVSEYSFEKFQQEIDRIAPVQIYHAIYMVRALLSTEEELPKDFGDLSLEAMKSNVSPALKKKLEDIFRLTKKFGYF